jgi:hypothetical protein
MQAPNKPADVGLVNGTTLSASRKTDVRKALRLSMTRLSVGDEQGSRRFARWAADALAWRYLNTGIDNA